MLLWLPQVTFETTVLATSCSEDRAKWKDHFYVYPVGLSEKLRIDFELMCECDCEQSGQEVGETVLGC